MGCWERGDDFFQGGGRKVAVFTKKIKNLNCEILTKHLDTFKRWDGVKDEKLWGFTTKSNF